MDKSNMLIMALLALIFIGFLHSRPYAHSATTKTVIVDQQPHYYRRYGYVPPPPHYNSYKSQYYN